MFLRDNSAQNARLLPGRSTAIGPDTLGRFTRILRAGISALPESALRSGGVGWEIRRIGSMASPAWAFPDAKNFVPPQMRSFEERQTPPPRSRPSSLRYSPPSNRAFVPGDSVSAPAPRKYSRQTRSIPARPASRLRSVFKYVPQVRLSQK